MYETATGIECLKSEAALLKKEIGELKRERDYFIPARTEMEGFAYGAAEDYFRLIPEILPQTKYATKTQTGTLETDVVYSVPIQHAADGLILLAVILC